MVQVKNIGRESVWVVGESLHVAAYVNPVCTLWELWNVVSVGE